MATATRNGRAFPKPVALFCFLALAAALVFLAQGQAAHAATITVTTTDDELNSDGDCSLREAIQAANTNVAVDLCPAGSGADTIVVPAGTYTLSIAGADENANASGDLDITGTADLTINGATAATTIIDGAGLDRVFHILGGPPVKITRLTIQNGSVTDSAGGGIFNGAGATLTLNSSTVTGNTAVAGDPFLDVSSGGGIVNQGTLTLINVTVSGNTADAGGGILNDTIGMLTVHSSTVSGNSSNGIANLGTATLNSSTVSGNSGDDGGGIVNGGPLTVENSTISGNAASIRGGGIFTSIGGTLTLNSSTISDNSAPSGGGGGGGGIYIYAHPSSGTPILKNTIVANNTSGDDCSGSITSADHNLDSDDTCNLIGTGDIPSGSANLGPLALNAPGTTETHALLPPSDAIDAGSITCPYTDQRGVARPQGAACDIGAFELGAVPAGPLFAVDAVGIHWIQRLISIDPDTAQVATVATVSGPNVSSPALAFSPNGELIGYDQQSRRLYRLDVLTGQIALIGAPGAVQAPDYPTTQVSALAFDGQGNLFGLDSFNDLLLSIDPSSGASSVIGSVGGIDIHHAGLAVDFTTGELFAVMGGKDGAPDKLLRIDKQTGQATIIGELGFDLDAVGVEFNPVTGELFTVLGTNILMKLNRDTGAATVVGTLTGLAGVAIASLAARWPDGDGNGLADSFEDGFGGEGIKIINPETNNTASATGSAAGGSTITSGSISVTFPSGTQVLGAGKELEIRVFPGPPPKLEIGNADLPTGETKTVEMPIDGGTLVCIDDKVDATIEVLGAGGCDPPPADPEDCPPKEIGIQIPSLNQSETVSTKTPSECTSTTYTITRISLEKVEIKGLVHTAIAIVPSAAVGGTTELLVGGSDSASGASSSARDYTAPIAAGVTAAAAFAIAAVAWYVRRRWLR